MTVDEYAAAEHNRANDNARKVHALAAQVEAAYADRDAALERLGAVGEELRVLRRLHEVETERTVGLAAVIEQALATLNDGDRWAEGLAIDILASADTDAALREVRAEALEDAASDIVLAPVAEWRDRHGNAGIRENGEAEASAWLERRAAEIREGAKTDG